MNTVRMLALAAFLAASAPALALEGISWLGPWEVCGSAELIAVVDVVGLERGGRPVGIPEVTTDSWPRLIGGGVPGVWAGDLCRATSCRDAVVLEVRQIWKGPDVRRVTATASSWVGFEQMRAAVAEGLRAVVFLQRNEVPDGDGSLQWQLAYWVRDSGEPGEDFSKLRKLVDDGGKLQAKGEVAPEDRAGWSVRALAHPVLERDVLRDLGRHGLPQRHRAGVATAFLEADCSPFSLSFFLRLLAGHPDGAVDRKAVRVLEDWVPALRAGATPPGPGAAVVARNPARHEATTYPITNLGVSGLTLAGFKTLERLGDEAVVEYLRERPPGRELYGLDELLPLWKQARAAGRFRGLNVSP